MEISRKDLMQIINEERSILVVEQNTQELNEGIKDTLIALVAALGFTAGEVEKDEWLAAAEVLKGMGNAEDYVDFSGEGTPLAGKGALRQQKAFVNYNESDEKDAEDIKESIKNIIEKTVKKK